jgi:hypothetical protein
MQSVAPWKAIPRARSQLAPWHSGPVPQAKPGPMEHRDCENMGNMGMPPPAARTQTTEAIEATQEDEANMGNMGMPPPAALTVTTEAIEATQEDEPLMIWLARMNARMGQLENFAQGMQQSTPAQWTPSQEIPAHPMGQQRERQEHDDADASAVPESESKRRCLPPVVQPATVQCHPFSAVDFDRFQQGVADASPQQLSCWWRTLLNANINIQRKVDCIRKEAKSRKSSRTSCTAGSSSSSQVARCDCQRCAAMRE